MTHSYDSGTRPLTNVQYQSANNNPYNPGYGDYNQSSGYLPPKKKGMSRWIKIGIPLLIIIIAGAVVGGILGSRSSKKSSASGSGSDPAAASSAVANKDAVGVFATSTDFYGQPIYPTATNAAFVIPTFVANAKSAWPAETFKPASASATNLRPDRPRLIAPKYKWDALPGLISGDPYMKKWNATIIANATGYLSLPLVPYRMDGDSGVLDVARELKMRIKSFAYSYRVTGDKKFLDRTWDELQNAAANTSNPFGTAPDNWNSGHFLDVAEFTAAFAIGYDWLYDSWSTEQKNGIMWSILNLGLNWGLQAYGGAGFGWWRLPDGGSGNWNCVCNSGLTMGALAILNDDPTDMSRRILAQSVPNAVANCAHAPTSDGSWQETADYWYFGTTAHAEMSASLLSATGSDLGMLTSYATFNQTALFHMYITGMTSMFQWGDHGPNKFSTTANSMIFYGAQYKAPSYMLFQRDRPDAWSDPWSIFYYDPTVAGAYWHGLPLDHFFQDPQTQWGSMRSSWTDTDGTFLAIKAGNNSGHQNHQDLDVGDFVFDAMGERWAGELGSGDYLSSGYFVGNNPGDPRWLYYRKRTEGQNTIVVGKANQNLVTAPQIKTGTTGEVQDGSPAYTLPKTSTAWFTMDSTSAYANVNSMKRGARFINGRTQILLQDEVDTTADIEWRMHTNATLAFPSDNKAVLTLNGKTLEAIILSPATGAKFEKLDPVRYDTDPALPTGQSDQVNPGVSVLAIKLPSGQHNIQVLFNPQWPGKSDFVTPPSVPIDQWTQASHN